MSVPPPRLEEVADDVYAWIQPDGGWCLSNSGILRGRDAVAVVDTGATEARARALAARVAGLGRPASVLVNTHHHGDHTFGNCVFGSDVTVLAHHSTRQEMAERGLALQRVWPDTAWGDVELVLPTLTFADRMELHLGGLDAELIHVGPAHTGGDVVVWLPRQRVLFAGDVVMPGCTPFYLMGSSAGMLRALERLRELGPRVVVGGHGPVTGPEVLDETAAYVRYVERLAREGAASGRTPLRTAQEATAAGLGGFGGLRDSERIVANLHRAASEARGLPVDTQIRSAPVFDEMVRLNGGRALTCRA